MQDLTRLNTETDITYKDFLARMSHELRTPLNGIIGMTSLLANTTLTHEQNDVVEIIRSSGEELLKMVNTILDFSKADANKLILEHTKIDLRKIVDGVVDTLVGSARVKNLHMYVNVDEIVPNKLLGDETRIRQVYMSVVSNAIKFTEVGSIRVIVTCTHLDDNTLAIRTEVHDTGIGTSCSNTLFEPFVQADMSITRNFGGAGLGLSIAKSLVQAMQGEIGILEGETNGSIFWFTMKLSRSRGHDKSRPTKSNQKTVVVVTSDNLLYDTISVYLTAWGYKHVMEDISKVSRFSDAIFLCDTINLQNRDSNIRELFPNAHVCYIRYACDLTNILSDNWIYRPVKRQNLYESLRPKAKNTTIELLSGLVLIAEDNLINQKVLKMHMERLGFISEMANNGLEVLLKLQECKTYKLILMDCHMPQMDGLTCTRAIRANEVENTSPRIFIAACTGGAYDLDETKCLQSGMDMFISKPIRRSELMNALKMAGLSQPSLLRCLAPCTHDVTLVAM